MDLDASLQNQELQAETTLQEIRAREIAEMEYIERQKQTALKNAEKQGVNLGLNAPTQKWSLASFFLLLLLCVFGDIIDIFTLGTIGWFTGLIIDGIILLTTGLSKSGRKQFSKMLIGVIGETIPGIAFFPFRTAFLVWAYIKSKKN